MDNSMQGEQLSPHNVEAEEAVLGAVLIHSESLRSLIVFLRADDFFIVRHTWIWTAMIALQERRDPIDYLTVVNELEQMGKLTELGGAAYILSLVNKTPSALNAEGYGRIVERMSLRRRMLDAAGGIARVAHSDETDIDEVVAQSEKAIMNVVLSYEGRIKIINSKKAEEKELDRIEYLIRRTQSGLSPAISTGFPPLDEILDGGWYPGVFGLIEAWTSVGKSIWLKQSALASVNAGIGVGFVSLEMGAGDLRRRMKSEAFKINPKWLKTGNFPEGELARYYQTIGESEQWRLFFVEKIKGWWEIKRAIKQMYYDPEKEVEIVFIDYVQLIQIPSTKEYRFSSRKHELQFIAADIQALAIELNIPIITAAQASRKHWDRQDHTLRLDDVSDAKDLPDSADIVIALNKPSLYGETADRDNLVVHDVLKHRDGELGVYPSLFNTDYLYFDTSVKSKAVDLNWGD